MIQRLDGHQDQAGAWDVLEAASGVLAFDVGANIGQSTKVLAQRFVKVLAFEPCRESFDVLAVEMPANVTPACIAVSDHDGRVTLEEDEVSIATGQLVTGTCHLPMWGNRLGTRTVACVTLDRVVESVGVPDFVKVDVEGHELHVLRGGRRLFTEHAPPVIVEVHSAGHEAVIRRLLANYDLTKLTHGPYARPGGPVHTNHFWVHGSPR